MDLICTSVGIVEFPISTKLPKFLGIVCFLSAESFSSALHVVLEFLLLLLMIKPFVVVVVHHKASRSLGGPARGSSPEGPARGSS